MSLLGSKWAGAIRNKRCPLSHIYHTSTIASTLQENRTMEGWLLGGLFVIFALLMLLSPIAITLLIFVLCARKITRHMGISATPWLIVGVSGASIASLVQGRFLPAVYGMVTTPERIHRGWPLPWLGVRGFEKLVVPYTLAIDTLVWTVLICTSMYVVSLFAHRIQSVALRHLALLLTTTGVTVIACLIPFIIPAFTFE